RSTRTFTSQGPQPGSSTSVHSSPGPGVVLRRARIEPPRPCSWSERCAPAAVHDAGWASCRRGVPGSGWEPARRGYGAPRRRGRSPSPPSEADQAEGGLLSAPPELARVAARAEAERLDHRGGLREAVGECRGRVGVAAQADRAAALLGPPLRHPRPQAPGVHLERPAAGGDRAHRGAELLLEAPRVDGPPVLLGPVAQRVVEVGDDLERLVP